MRDNKQCSGYDFWPFPVGIYHVLVVVAGFVPAIPSTSTYNELKQGTFLALSQYEIY